MLNIALDFDGTYTRAPQEFDQMVELFRKAGHKVWLVTMRYPPPHMETEDVVSSLTGKVDGFFYTSRQAKVKWMDDYTDIKIDIWIDDCPFFLLRNSY